MGRISCAGGVFVAVAGTGVAAAGTGGVDVVVIGARVPFEGASLCPRTEESCVVGKSLRRLQRREEEPSIEGVPNLPGREAGLLANAERLSSRFLGAAVLVVLVVWNVAWLSVVVRGCGLRVVGIVVGKLVLEGVDEGTDPVGEGALALSF